MASLSIMTWNILAPCYKKLVQAGGQKVYESQRSAQYLERSSHIFNFILAKKPDVVCLQEFWVQSEEYVAQFEQMMRPNYSLHYLKRTNLKEDGVVTLVSKHISVNQEAPFCFQDAGDRVVLLMNLTHKERNFLVLNTHLTFPHGDFDHKLRKTQINKISQYADDYIARNSIAGVPVFIAGDLNGESDDYVIQHLKQKGYSSTHESIHGKEPEVTHKNHNGFEVAVDFVFIGQSHESQRIITPKEAYLLPEGIPEQNFMDHFDLSDHRPLLCQYTL